MTLAILVFGKNLHSYQVITLLLYSLLTQQVILTLKPKLDSSTNHLLLFNEMAVSVYLYLMLALTMLNVDNPGEQALTVREIIGMALLGVVGITLLVNLIFAAVRDVRAIYRYIKMRVKRLIKKKEMVKVKKARKSLKLLKKKIKKRSQPSA